MQYKILINAGWWLLSLLLLVACAGTRAPVDDSDLRLQAASKAFGGRYDYLIVTADGLWADQAAVEMSRVIGPNQLSRDLASRLLQAAAHPVRILVSGHNRQKTLQVIRDAFSFTQGQRLTQLEFLFLGNPDDAQKLRPLVEAVGGRFRFAAF